MTQQSIEMVDRVTDAFFALDADWRFTYLNDRADALLVHSRSDPIGRLVWDEFPDAVGTQFRDRFDRAMDEQVSVSFEVYHAPLETWFETRAYPSETGLSVSMWDVTERETALVRHTAAVEAASDCVFTLDRDDVVASVDESTAHAFALDCEDLIGEHVETLARTASDGDAAAAELGRAIRDLRAGDADRRTVYVPVAGAGGDERVGELRLVPVTDDATRIAGVVRDVTERREYERIVTSLHELTRWLLRSDDPEEICAVAVHAGSDLLDLPISGVWLLDDERGCLEPVAGTAGAHDEFGGLPRFDHGDGLVWDVFEDGEPALFDDLRDVDGLYNPDTPLRSEIVAPIGTHGVLMTGSFEPRSFDETDLELVSTLVENTRAALDRTARERTLRERTRQLERQTERFEAVADVLSGDLTRRLETVADALRTDDTGASVLSTAENALTTTLDRTERLVDDVREFARDATAVGPRRRIALETAVADAVDASRIESASVVVEASATVRVDPDRFAHLLETVFTDAAVRSDGDVTVQIGLLGVDEPIDGSRGFVVVDDGPTVSTVDHEGGPGLGLTAASAIAEAHGWSVSISSDDGGTRFEVRDVTTLERS